MQAVDDETSEDTKPEQSIEKTNTIDPISQQEAVARNSQTFYIDSVNGDDSKDGLSEATAWKSLEKVNEQVFQPGDNILFHAGSAWEGQLKPKGSGTAENPIKIGSYGSDGNTRPIFNGNGKVRDSIYLLDVEF